MLMDKFEEIDNVIREHMRKKLKTYKEGKKKLTEEQIDELISEIEPTAIFYESPQEMDLSVLKNSNGKSTLIIFDDLLLEKKSANIIETFTKSRHVNISTIYLTQSFYQTPKLIRQNISHFIIFKKSSGFEKYLLYRSLCSGDMEKDEFYELCSRAWGEPFSCLYIDTTVNCVEPYKYRRNLDIPLH